MRPKKRIKLSVNLTAQPGITKSHLELNFPDLPASQSDLKNGHVLNLFLSNDKSQTETGRQLSSHFSLPHGEGYLSPALKSSVQVLVSKTLLKFKKPKDPKEFDLFTRICDESFKLKGNHKIISSNDIAPSAAFGTDSEAPSSAPSPEPSTSGWKEPIPHENFPEPTASSPDLPDSNTPTSAADIPMPTPSTSGVSTRSKKNVLTPRKERLKKRLDFVSKAKVNLAQKYQMKINELKTQMKTPKRVINQSIKRKQHSLQQKDTQIQKLKYKLHGKGFVQELAETKGKLMKLENAHKKLLKKQREKKNKTIPILKYRKLQEQLKDREDDIRQSEFDNLLLQETVANMEAAGRHVKAKVDHKTYSTTTRMHVFDCIVSNTSTASIPVLISQIYKRSGRELDQVPQRSTVEFMARELGAIAELQTAETLLATNDVTMGFDATTQEEIHVNSIHFTTKSTCVSAAVDELAGGTAEDYAQHICQTIDNLSETYCYFNDHAELQETRKKMINNITNTMSDRCASNHAAVRVVNREWGKTLNELYCHLHPLDSVASSVRSTLRQHEETTQGKIYGKDCVAANIVLQVNKLRYKNSKGDPRGFIAFLDDRNIPRGVLPRYRGNRLHVIFHISGKLLEHYDDFIALLSTGTSCGGLRNAILHDFTMDQAKLELQVLGLLGKHLTGPWMKKFYTSSQTEINHIDGIRVVKLVIEALKEATKHPESLMSATEDFFNGKLHVDATLQALRERPVDSQFITTMRSCLQAIIAVLERQYCKYFEVDVTERLREETASARSHNIDAEEIMGMFSSMKQKCPSATMCYLSCRMRACKNKTVQYIDELDESRKEDVLRKAVKWGRMQRSRRKRKQRELRGELIRRHKDKEQLHETKERKKLEKKLKETDLESVRQAFPNLDFSESKCAHVEDILNGRIVGRKACHAWYEDQELVVYNAKFEKLKNKLYKVAYWSQSEMYDDATDYDVLMFQLAADVLYGDLVFC